MNYTIKNINDSTFIFDFQPKNTVLTLFLEGDFTAFHDQFLQLIDNVLDDKSKSEEMTGNSTNVVFKKDMTTIEDLFLDGEPTLCTIQTSELRSLMDEWLQKRAEFLKTKG